MYLSLHILYILVMRVRLGLVGVMFINGLVNQSINYLNVGLLQVVRPRREQVLPHLLFKVAGIGNESCREQAVSSDGGHLVLEGLTGLLPAVPFS